MLLQLEMIERLRRICQQDDRVLAAMLYGSFTRNEADEYSDIDTVLFFRDESLPEIDQPAWVSQIAPVEIYYRNELGNGVAIFDNLVREEFHFDRASDMQKIEAWQGNAWFPSLAAVLLVDKTGQLSRHLQALIGPPPSHNTAEDVHFLRDSFLNWFLFGTNVLARGELARALELLNLIHDYLLRMIRLAEGSPERWVSPATALEREISAVACHRYQACTARLEHNALLSAYLSTWQWGNELMAVLAERHSVALPTTLMDKINRRIRQLAGA
jgi:lincosamide nucleotidyltransferase